MVNYNIKITWKNDKFNPDEFIRVLKIMLNNWLKENHK